MPQSKKTKEQMVPGEMTGKMYPASERAKWQKQESASLTGMKKDIANAAAKTKTVNTLKKFSTNVSVPVKKSIAAMAMKQAPERIAFMKKMAQSKKK